MDDKSQIKFRYLPVMETMSNKSEKGSEAMRWLCVSIAEERGRKTAMTDGSSINLRRTKNPADFVHPPETVLQNPSSCNVSDLQVPVIDFETIGGEIVDEIRNAAGKWGIFQVINHGIVASVMEEMIEGIRRFHEQPQEVKMEWYSRENEEKVKYYSNGDLYVSKAVSWQDSISCHYADGALDPNQLPHAFRIKSV
ncbi:hypothetical protein LXL04_028388 [Taraxacum kok-saghyz]